MDNVVSGLDSPSGDTFRAMNVIIYNGQATL